MKSLYPGNRPQYFAVQFCRELSQRKAAQDIGAAGFALLTIVVMTEDATGYERPVRFWRDDLAAKLGISTGTLDRLRKKCIAAGWLQYVQNTRDKAGAYWVSIPVAAARDQEDQPRPEHTLFEVEDAEYTTAASAEETPTARPAEAPEAVSESVPCGARRRAPTSAPARTNLSAGAHHSYLSSLSSPKSPLPPAGGMGVCAETPDPRVSESKPPKPPRPPREKTVQRTLFDAIAEVSGSDPVVNRSRIRRLAISLNAAGYEPQHVRDFGQRFHDLCGYSLEVRLLHPRPSLRVIETKIGLLRAGPAPKQPVHAGPPRNRREEKADFAKRMFATAFGVSKTAQTVPETA